MTTNSLEEFFVQGLQEVYYTEQKLIDALEKLADETDDETARQAFSEHRDETERQVDRLNQVFDQIGEEPEAKAEMIVDALIDEHEQFARENDGSVLDRYNISAGQKTEHHEIAAYGNLTSMAGKLGFDEAADLLEETLREEEAALDKLSRAAEQFDERQVAAD